MLGQRVQVTANTVFDDDLRGGLASLAVGQIVEVYGLLNSAGKYTATRIEREDSFTSQYKLRRSAGSTPRHAPSASARQLFFMATWPTRAVPLADGQYARVELFTTPTGGQRRASRLQVTHCTNLPTIGNVNVELEGYITGLRQHHSSVSTARPCRCPAACDCPRGLPSANVWRQGRADQRADHRPRGGTEDDDGGVDDGGFEIEGAITQIDTAARTPSPCAVWW